MPSIIRMEEIVNPTKSLEELFENQTDLTDFAETVEQHFSEAFFEATKFQQIPVLNLQNPSGAHPPRGLVRFRGMIQDPSTSTEMYLLKLPNGKLGGWGIEHPDATTNDEIDYSNLRECNVHWAVNVPGETQWATQELDGESTSNDSKIQVSTRPHKYPEAGRDHIGVQLKLYSGSQNESLKSTDIATFVGILTSEHLSSSEAEEQHEVPTLHVLFTTKRCTEVSRPFPVSGTSYTSETVRLSLLRWLAQEALSGDLDAAEWVLLTAIARTQTRHPPIYPPSLTISHFPPPPSGSSSQPTLSLALSLVLTLAHTLPITVDYLNSRKFNPESKDEDLHSGELQLPKGTVLVVAETGLQEGKVLEKGLMNIQALQEVMSSQTLAYAFPFSRFTFPTDISCIVLCQGAKSTFFKTDIIVPLKPQSTEPSNLYKSTEEINLPPPEELAAFRDWIVGARSGKIQITEDVSKFIQQDFVNDRKEDPSVTSDDLMRRMTIAKLYALSMHQENLTADLWNKAKSLDERRRLRST
ncbi:mini-chromosome maintenance replisome factor-domain-containing protein [Abortiporus biennis]|nr:mini-chromosome maintenance replisome factor-domain-containing protein [Abortiporus biennis]